jgi:hypothetical protein
MLIDINSFRPPLYTLEYKRQIVVKPGHLFGGGVAVVIVLLFFLLVFWGGDKFSKNMITCVFCWPLDNTIKIKYEFLY